MRKPLSNTQLLQTPQTLVVGAHVLRHVRIYCYAAQQNCTPLGRDYREAALQMATQRGCNP